MIKPSRKYRTASIALLFVLLAQACEQVKLDAPPALPTAREIESVSTEERSAPLATSTTLIEIPAATEMIPASASSLPKVTISAVKGNIFIRRGPDLAFNPIDKGLNEKYLILQDELGINANFDEHYFWRSKIDFIAAFMN